METKSGSVAVDRYIADFPAETQALLQQVRFFIQELVPDAEESINYGIPTFKLHGNLVHFAGYKQHIGFYPGASGIEAFQDEIKNYKFAKGSVQFPLDKEIPYDLIRRITLFRVDQNREKAKTSGKK